MSGESERHTISTSKAVVLTKQTMEQTSYRLFLNSMFLLIIDAHSKWVEIFKTSFTTSAATTVKEYICSVWYSAQTIVSDNSSCLYKVQ